MTAFRVPLTGFAAGDISAKFAIPCLQERDGCLDLRPRRGVGGPRKGRFECLGHGHWFLSVSRTRHLRIGFRQAERMVDIR